ncbi:MAG: hypothetical protein KDA85_18225 [Planctomycetaceae bacterium]|nr:hypothetical protein [Planctomycetaceae bacterium]
MKRTIWFSILVLAFTGVQPVMVGADGAAIAQPPAVSLTGTAPRVSSQAGKPVRPLLPPVFNGFSVFRAAPDLGAPGSAGSGHQHFTMPMHQYTGWYRPRAATLTSVQRCEPDSFRPRGLGHLFARPCDGYRMEYTPYALSDEPSIYGPAYIARQPDPRCEHCDHSAECRDCQQ